MNWGLPTSVEIGGESYEIRTDFRVILDIFVMLSDPDLSGTDRAEGILQMFYVSPEDIPPQHLQEAVDRFTWFQNGGKEQDMEENDLGYIVDYKRYDADVFTGVNRRTAAVFQFHSAALRRLNKVGCQRYEGDYTRLKQKHAERRARRMAG